jgi:hypothetical protein
MTCTASILALFPSDDVVLTRTEILARLGLPPLNVDVALTHLVKRGRLFRIARAEYARTASAATAVVRLERRVSELEAQVAFLLKSFVAGAA